MRDIPFALSKVGYKRDPNNPRRFLPPPPGTGPFYPVEFSDDLHKTEGDCLLAMLYAAYEQGARDAYALKAKTIP